MSNSITNNIQSVEIDEILINLETFFSDPISPPPPEEYEYADLANAILAIVRAVENKTERGQVLMPTATGKTIVMAEAIRLLVEHADCPQSSFVMTGSTIELSAQHITTLHDFIAKAPEGSRFSNTRLLLVCSDKERQNEMDDLDVPLDDVTTDPNVVASRIEKYNKADVPFIIVSTYHSLERVVGEAFKMLGDDHNLDITFYDEAHNATNNQWSSTVYQEEDNADEEKKLILRDTPNYHSDFRFFLTATPRHTIDESGKEKTGTRKTGMDNVEAFGEVLYHMTPKEAINKGMIIPPEIVIAKIHGGYDNFISNIGEDETEQEQQELKGEATLVLDGIKKVYNKTGKIKFIVYARSVDHARYLKDNVDWAAATGIPGMKTYFVHAGITGNDRKTAIDGFKSDENAIMFNYRIFSEGINIEDVNGVVALRAFEDAVTLAQIIGRALRLDPRDRALLKSGDIEPGITNGWNKLCGYLVVPETFGRSSNKRFILKRATDFIKTLYNFGFEDSKIYGFTKPNDDDLTEAEKTRLQNLTGLGGKYNLQYGLDLKTYIEIMKVVKEEPKAGPAKMF